MKLMIGLHHFFKKFQFEWPQLYIQANSSFTARAKTPTSNRFKILKKFRNYCV
jgi:hypothetical protein